MHDSINILNGNVVLPKGIFENGMISVKNGVIKEIRKPRKSLQKTKGVPTIDAKGKYILPGFIDLHVHGGGGADTMDANYEAFCSIAQSHSKYGTTSLCLATVSSSDRNIIYALAEIAKAAKCGTKYSNILGAYLEGPFINPDKKCRGVHDKKHIYQSSERFLKFLEAADGCIKVVVVAPEMPFASSLIKIAVNNGIIPSIGHTKANFEETKEAINLGVKNATHIFNCMTGFHHRDPGAVGALLTDENVMIELIADKHLVSETALKLTVKVAGLERVILVTDCLRPLDSKPLISHFQLSAKEIYVRDLKCYLNDGSFCNSLLTMDQALRNIIESSNLSLAEAIKLVSTNPAKQLGVINNKGTLEIGKDGDLVIVDDSLNIAHTIVGGKIVFNA
jgi:N-acetylglucosamine-6-phosphate deacetylase